PAGQPPAPPPDHASIRTLGSATSSRQSASHVPTRTVSDAATVTAASSAKSAPSAASTVAAATPGHAKTVSTTSDPTITSGTREPSSAMSGAHATGATCLVRTVHLLSP